MKTPFKLLDAYLEGERDKFFGRDAEIEQQYEAVHQSKLIVIYGLSGTGKTSILRCGLYNEFEGPDWYPLFVRTGSDVNTSIRNVLYKALKGKNVTGDNVKDTVELYKRSYRPPYLIIDQFEEFFTLKGNTKDIQNKFMMDLRGLLDADLEARIVLVMREEYLAQLSSFESIVPELFDFRFRVERMHPDKVKQVVRDSFSRFNISLEEPSQDNLDLIVRNISSEGVIDLPYLQVYLDMLYEKAARESDLSQGNDHEGWPQLLISRDQIQEQGEISDVLEQFLIDSVSIYTRYYRRSKIEGIPADFVRRLLGMMVTERGTKLPVPIDLEVTEGGVGDSIIVPHFDNKIQLETVPKTEVSGLITKLIDQQIIARKIDTIEIAHDSLAAIIAQWSTDEEKHRRVLYSRIQMWFEQYEELGQDDASLLTETQLASIRDDEQFLNLDEKYRQFIAKSKEARDERERLEMDRQRRETEQRDNALLAEKKARRQKKITIVISVGFIFVLVFFAVLINLKDREHYRKEVRLQEELLQVRQANLEAVGQRESQLYTAETNKQILGDKSEKEDHVEESSTEESVPEVEAIVDRPSVYIIPTSFVTASKVEKGVVVDPRDDFVLNSDISFFARVVVDTTQTIFGHIEDLSSGRIIPKSQRDFRVSRNPAGFRVWTAFRMKEAGVFRAVIKDGQGNELGAHAFQVRSPSGAQD